MLLNNNRISIYSWCFFEQKLLLSNLVLGNFCLLLKWIDLLSMWNFWALHLLIPAEPRSFYFHHVQLFLPSFPSLICKIVNHLGRFSNFLWGNRQGVGLESTWPKSLFRTWCVWMTPSGWCRTCKGPFWSLRGHLHWHLLLSFSLRSFFDKSHLHGFLLVYMWFI